MVQRYVLIAKGASGRDWTGVGGGAARCVVRCGTFFFLSPRCLQRRDGMQCAAAGVESVNVPLLDDGGRFREEEKRRAAAERGDWNNRSAEQRTRK